MLYVTPDNWISPMNAHGATGWVDTLDIDKVKADKQKPKPSVGGDDENDNPFMSKEQPTLFSMDNKSVVEAIFRDPLKWLSL